MGPDLIHQNLVTGKSIWDSKLIVFFNKIPKNKNKKNKVVTHKEFPGPQYRIDSILEELTGMLDVTPNMIADKKILETYKIPSDVLNLKKAQKLERCYEYETYGCCPYPDCTFSHYKKKYNPLKLVCDKYLECANSECFKFHFLPNYKNYALCPDGTDCTNLECNFLHPKEFGYKSDSLVEYNVYSKNVLRLCDKKDCKCLKQHLG